jgi:hypothetical protein
MNPPSLEKKGNSSLQNIVLNNSTTIDNVQKVNHCENMYLVPRVSKLKLCNNTKISHYCGLYRF